MAAKVFTLDDFKRHLEDTYSAVKIGGVSFRNMLALPAEQREKFAELAASMSKNKDKGKDAEDGSVSIESLTATLREMVLLFVMPSDREAAEALLDELEPLPATYQAMLDVITEGTQVGEASASQD